MTVVGTATEFKLKKCDTWLKHNVLINVKKILLKNSPVSKQLNISEYVCMSV